MVVVVVVVVDGGAVVATVSKNSDGGRDTVAVVVVVGVDVVVVVVVVDVVVGVDVVVVVVVGGAVSGKASTTSVRFPLPDDNGTVVVVMGATELVTVGAATDGAGVEDDGVASVEATVAAGGTCSTASATVPAGPTPDSPLANSTDASAASTSDEAFSMAWAWAASALGNGVPSSRPNSSPARSTTDRAGSGTPRSRPVTLTTVRPTSEIVPWRPPAVVAATAATTKSENSTRRTRPSEPTSHCLALSVTQMTYRAQLL